MTDIHALRLYDTPSSREKEAERQQLFVKGSGRPPRMIYGHCRVKALIANLKEKNA